MLSHLLYSLHNRHHKVIKLNAPQLVPPLLPVRAEEQVDGRVVSKGGEDAGGRQLREAERGVFVGVDAVEDGLGRRKVGLGDGGGETRGEGRTLFVGSGLRLRSQLRQVLEDHVPTHTQRGHVLVQHRERPDYGWLSGCGSRAGEEGGYGGAGAGEVEEVVGGVGG